jgi:O-antigen/teichoic acid export membrane protein
MSGLFSNVWRTWFSQGIIIVGQIAKAPLLYAYLGNLIDGWYLIISLIGFTAMMELGIYLTAYRFLGRAIGRNIVKLPKNETDIFSFENVVATLKLFFYFVTCFMIIIGGLLGCVYLSTVSLPQSKFSVFMLAWILVSACQGITVYASQYSAILGAAGYPGQDSLIKAYATAISIIFLAVVLWAGGGIWGAVASELVRSVWVFFVLKNKVKRLQLPYGYFDIKAKWIPSVAKQILIGQGKTFVANAGATITNTADGPLIASLIKLKSLANFTNTQSAISMLSNQVTAILISAFPKFLHNISQNDMYSYRELFLRTLRYSMLLYSIVSGFLLLAGKQIFSLWLGAENFIGVGIIVSLILYFLIEIHNSTWQGIFFAKEYIPFWYINWINAAIRFILAFLLTERWGLYGIIYSKIGAVILTTGWYIPYKGFSLMGFCWNWRKIFSVGIPIYIPLVLYPSLGLLIKYWLKNVEITSWHFWISILVYGFFSCGGILFLSEEDRGVLYQKIFGIIKKPLFLD